jgi:hypothetical protein
LQKNQDRSASGTDADPLKSSPRIVSRDQDQRYEADYDQQRSSNE